MERKLIFKDEAKCLELRGKANAVENLTNELLGTLKRRDMIHTKKGTDLFADLVHGGALIMESLRAYLKKQMNGAGVLLSTIAGHKSMEIENEVEGMIKAFTSEIWTRRGYSPRSTNEEAVQCVKWDAEKEIAVYDETMCEELCSVYLDTEKESSVYERVQQLRDAINVLDAELYEMSEHRLHLLSDDMNEVTLLTLKDGRCEIDTNALRYFKA